MPARVLYSIFAALLLLAFGGMGFQLRALAAPITVATPIEQACLCELAITLEQFTPSDTCYSHTTLFAQADADGRCDTGGCGPPKEDCKYTVSITIYGSNCEQLAIYQREPCDPQQSPFGLAWCCCQNCNQLTWSSPQDPEDLGCGGSRCYEAYSCDTQSCGFAGHLAARIKVECLDC